jgi:hypothetical protein
MRYVCILLLTNNIYFLYRKFRVLHYLLLYYNTQKLMFFDLDKINAKSQSS